jgi:Fe-S-cluster containining protein
MTPESVEARLRDLWSRVAPRCAEFDLVLPGDSVFVCQAGSCPVHCCKVFGIVPLGEAELIRLSRSSGIAPLVLIETEDGEPLTHSALPERRPYFLARSGGFCRLLGADLLCSQYEGRPDACRQYPYYVFFFDPSPGRPIRAGWSEMRAALDQTVDGCQTAVVPALTPLLIRHRQCRGITGAPLARPDWQALFDQTFRLQYGDA